MLKVDWFSSPGSYFSIAAIKSHKLEDNGSVMRGLTTEMLTKDKDRLEGEDRSKWNVSLYVRKWMSRR